VNYESDTTSGFLPSAFQSQIIRELTELGYSGNICISGFSEPFLFPDLVSFLKELRTIRSAKIRLNTNGDFLSSSILAKISNYVDRLAISIYDNKEQEAKLRCLLSGSNISKMQVDFRDRYSNLKFINNRGGALNHKSALRTNTCYYPFYCFYIDWTGEVLFCPHNFQKHNIVGRLGQDSIPDIWFGKNFSLVRKLIKSNRSNLDSCRYCNVSGDRVGEYEYKTWD
jgi:MoaA/NifB/PqqE/SkfB family radical SAM enzyme